jgi:hypothetical protein
LVQVEILGASYPIIEQIHKLVDGAEKAAKIGGHLIVGFDCHLNLAGMVAVFDDLEHHAHPKGNRGCACLSDHRVF